MDTSFDSNTSSKRPMEKGRNPYDGLRPWSAITHGIGIILAIIGTIFLLIKTIPVHSVGNNIGYGIFCLTMIMLYTASTLYHSVNTSVKGRIALRKFDHIAVNFLIAGTYIPLCLTILNGTVGTVLLSIIWGLAIAGGLVSFFWINSPRWVTAGIYLGLGWVSVISIPFVWQNAGLVPILWMAGGGIFYTIGGVLYALKWPGRNNPRFGCHEIFHVFIVLGTIVHYGMVYFCMS
ncbi:MAG: hemolysin III family protein [Proteobacteria bacterium]|nr:hemolysin III family protein [Pseudomonadota bacterium]